MRIIFMGTPEFAVPCLHMLLEHPNLYSVVCVVTKPDMPKGRSYQMTAPPVKELAVSRNIPVLQPERVKTEAFQNQLRSYSPDLFITAAYGKILPAAVLEIPPLGCINVHASILPKYRGAAPLWHAVINGERESGITTMMTDAGMDTGDILMTDRYPIGENMTMGELHDALAALGPVTLQKTLDALTAGNLIRTPQNDAEATYSPMVNRDTGKIDWARETREIHNLVRGTNPFPVSYSFDENGTRLKIWRTLLTDRKRPAGYAPGDIVEASAEGIFVATGDGVIRIMEIQGPSAKKMTAGEYVNGHKITKFTRL
ncbi:MAG: methionyl-tRNA formyltransferase [Clostridia bacterium]